MASLRAGRDEARSLAFALHQSEPNPFDRSTRIRFDLPGPMWVSLEVFDLQGRRIATLADGFVPAGPQVREWNGRSRSGMRATPGVYLYRIRAGEHRDQRKLVLMP